MGRPLNKKYFGNRNVGANGQFVSNGSLVAGAEIGGEGIAGVTFTARGSYTTRPTVTIPAPAMADGVTAASVAVISRAKTLTAAPSGTQTIAYQVGQVLTLGTNGTTATVATLAATGSNTATNITSSGVLTVGTNITITQGTSITFGASTGTGGTPLANNTYYVLASVSSSSTVQITDTYAHAVAGTAASFTAGTISASTTITTGSSAGAIATVSTTPTAQGSYTTLVTTAQATTTVNGGAGATITVSAFEAASVTVGTAGSGYTGNESITFTQSVTGTIVLTTDSGAVGSATNRENAILAWAYIGSSLVEVDIQKQQSAKRYRINANSEEAIHGTRIGRLRYDGVADGTKLWNAQQGVEMNIIAKDSDGKTYFVKKLTAHTAVLVPAAINNSTIGINTSAGTLFAPTVSGLYIKVKWSFGAAVAPNSSTGEKGRVQILNA